MKTANTANLLVAIALLLIVAIPAGALGDAPGQLPPGKLLPAPEAIGRAPAGTSPGDQEAVAPEAPEMPLAGPSAFALDVYPGFNLVYFSNLEIPGAWSVVASVPEASSYQSGDFLGGDYTKLYVLNRNTDRFATINTTTGVTTPIATSWQDRYWSGLTGTRDGKLYGVSTVCDDTGTYLSALYRIEPSNGALTLVGYISNGRCIIDIAASPGGQIYGVDLLDDMLVRIDPNTAAGTAVGPLGFDANYAQGMDFDEASGVLYLAAYNNTTQQGELRIANTSVGGTTLVGAFPGGAEVDALGIRAYAPTAPALHTIDNGDGDGSYLVDWDGVTGATGYTLQEDDNGAFSSPTTRYSGANTQAQISHQALGTWYYRVQATNGVGTSGWSGSRSVNVTVESQSSWIYLPSIVRISFADPYEPNDSFETAWGPLASGTTYEAFFPKDTDANDFYYIVLPAAHSIEVWLTNVPAGNDYDLYLYDAAHVYIKHSATVGTADEHIAVGAQPAGKYYIRVTREVGSSQTQPYKLRVVFQ